MRDIVYVIWITQLFVGDSAKITQKFGKQYTADILQ